MGNFGASDLGAITSGSAGAVLMDGGNAPENLRTVLIFKEDS
jgi:hypothetical protein